MSKRQEIRKRRQRERIRNRILVILLVVVGALLVTFALILPSVQKANQAASATPVPVVTIVPRVINAPVDGLHLGNPNALVKVDVYEDFRCSACLYYSQKIESQVITAYVETGKVYYTYHTFIVIDTNDGSDASRRAANAALCANEQGRFWDYHDTLYANQLSESATLFTDTRLVTMAKNLNLDMASFNTCYQAKKYDQDVQTDLIKGTSLNLTGTPSILVNGQLTSMDKVPGAIDTALVGK